MRTLLFLAGQSLANRKFTVSLTIISIALSVALLLGVERIRCESKNSFTNTISGTDLIIGARGGQLQLLLYSVFRIGNATNNISWPSYQEIKELPEIQWTIPLSLGDSHRGFRVLGTNEDYFRYFTYANRQHLKFIEGRPFSDLYDAVLGAEVAKELGYQLEQSIVVAHGAGSTNLAQHGDKPFQVVGILQPTGTPVDRTVHVSLEAIEAIHLNWESGTTPLPGMAISAEHARRLQLTPKSITAFLVKLKSPLATFSLQRKVNQFSAEPLTAILPAVALQQLWQLIGVAEKALLAVSALVVLVGISGMMTTMLSSLNERRREMAILRSVGARPVHIFGLIIGEAWLLSTIGIVLGTAILYGFLALAQPFLTSQFGIHLTILAMSKNELLLLLLVWFAGSFAGIIPACKIYFQSLSDGLSIRI